VQDTQLQNHPVPTQTECVVHVFDDQFGVVMDFDHDPVCSPTEFHGAVRGLDAKDVSKFHQRLAF
jgi:hypothetical protein